jgi:CheY-like chemotaxis protein
VLALQGGGVSVGARETAESALGMECPPKLDGVRVLLVDDDQDTLEMLDAVLSKCEAEVVTAASVAEALREIERRRPDVLVSDIGMPEADGYEFIKRVRALEAERGDASIPALALTAYAKPEDRVRALAVGYQVHLSKPVEPAEFALVVANLIGRGGTAEARP